MRIEILVDNEDPQIFPLNKPKLIIGSHEGCDIILPASGVSRKHLIIVEEDESFFVIDQGSTNGTYINEERLVPGRRVEFTSFFPVRLGHNVLITLLSDDDANDLGFAESTNPSLKDPFKTTSSTADFNEATRAISLKDLQASKTESLVKKRQETVVKRKAQVGAPKSSPKNEKSRTVMVQGFCLLILSGAIYYNFFVKEPEVNELEKREPIAQVGEIKKAHVQVQKYKLVDQVDTTPKEKFPELIQDITCTNDLEKYLCDEFTKANITGWGVVQVGTMMNGLINGQKFYDEAREMLPPLKTPENREPTMDELKKYHDDLKFTSLLLFINQALPKNLNLEMLKEVNLTFALQVQPRPPKMFRDMHNVAPAIEEPPKEAPIEEVGPEEAKEFFVAVIVPESLGALQKSIEPRHLSTAKQYGPDTLALFKEYFIYY